MGYLKKLLNNIINLLSAIFEKQLSQIKINMYFLNILFIINAK